MYNIHYIFDRYKNSDLSKYIMYVIHAHTSCSLLIVTPFVFGRFPAGANNAGFPTRASYRDTSIVHHCTVSLDSAAAAVQMRGWHTLWDYLTSAALHIPVYHRNPNVYHRDIIVVNSG